MAKKTKRNIALTVGSGPGLALALRALGKKVKGSKKAYDRNRAKREDSN